MTTREEAKKLYEGKFFYEIVKVKAGRHAGTIQLFGPFDNILYANPIDKDVKSEYKYCQVVDGKVVAAFKE
jgi:hypothetical protein